MRKGTQIAICGYVSSDPRVHNPEDETKRASVSISLPAGKVTANGNEPETVWCSFFTNRESEMNKLLSLQKGDLVYVAGDLRFGWYEMQMQISANLTEIMKVKRDTGSVRPSDDEVDEWGEIDGPYAD